MMTGMISPSSLSAFSAAPANAAAIAAGLAARASAVHGPARSAMPSRTASSPSGRRSGTGDQPVPGRPARRGSLLDILV